MSHDTVTRLADSGEIKARRVGPCGWYRIDFDSLMDYLEKVSAGP